MLFYSWENQKNLEDLGHTINGGLVRWENRRTQWCSSKPCWITGG